MKKRISLLYVLLMLSNAILLHSQKKNPTSPSYSSKYVENAVSLLSVERYEEAIKQFEMLKKFKRDREVAIQGMIYCNYKLMNYKGLEGLKNELKSQEEAYRSLIEGIIEESKGNRVKAAEMYNQYLKSKDTVDLKIVERKLYGVAYLGYVRTSEAIKIKPTGNKYKPEIKTDNTVLSDHYTGGAIVKDKIYISQIVWNKEQKGLGSIVRKDGYQGSASSLSNSNSLTNYYLGGLSVDEKNNEMIVSKQNDEQVGWGRVKEKEYKKLTSISTQGMNNLQLFWSKYGEELKPGEFVKLSFCDKEYNYIHPHYFDKGRKLLFSSDMPGGYGGYDLYVIERSEGGNWSAPKNLGSTINSIGDEGYASVVGDSILYYSSNGKGSYGNLDIYYSKLKITPSISFEDSYNAGEEINTSMDDVGYMQVGKRQAIYFTNKEEVNKDKLKLIEYPVRYRSLKGLVKDKLYETSIKDGLIDIYVGDSMIASVLSNDIGKFGYNELLEDQAYKLIISKPGYKKAIINIEGGEGEISYEQPNPIYLEPIIEKKTVFRFNNILFDLGKADLKDSSKVILDRLAELLINNPNVKVELSAHTDSRSSASSNMKLSGKRAKSCVDYLIYKGVKSENLISKGYGESKLLNGCKDGVKCSEEEHAINRRVEIKVLDIK